MKQKVIFSIIFILTTTNCFSQDFHQKTIGLINLERKNNDLPPLKYNEKLEDAAQFHAEWMGKIGVMTHLQGERPRDFIIFQNCTHHPFNRIVKYGYLDPKNCYNVIHSSKGISIKLNPRINDMQGEVIAHAKGYSSKLNINQQILLIVSGWMKSPGHKKELLHNSYKEAGVGYAKNKNGSFWCVNFGNNYVTMERN